MLKNIIFDLGGVLLDIDYSKTTKAFESIGYRGFENMYSQYSVDTLFAALEKGKVTKEHFVDEMLSRSNKQVTSADIISAWNAMLLNWRIGSLDFLKILSAEFQLFLYSNTNVIHFSAFTKMYREQTGRSDSLSDYFSKIYLSQEIGFRKPDAEGFYYILDDAKIVAAETLFIDDSFNNIEAAGALDFKTHLLKKEEKIENLTYTGFSS